MSWRNIFITLWGCEGHPSCLPGDLQLNGDLKDNPVLVRDQQSRMLEELPSAECLGWEMRGWIAEDEVGGEKLFGASHAKPTEG